VGKERVTEAGRKQCGVCYEITVVRGMVVGLWIGLGLAWQERVSIRTLATCSTLQGREGILILRGASGVAD
jgi:hypothetical protein